jgi:prepilin-type N-terminal cleavage/methylation domain-containing protein
MGLRSESWEDCRPMREPRIHRGFTLIELMITIAIVGILASIAVPMLTSYIRKSKQTEAHLAVDKMTKNVRVFHLTHKRFPVNSNMLPAISACVNPTGKTPATPKTDWFLDPGWKELEFFIDEPGHFQYDWQVVAPIGTARAIGDLNCDGVNGFLITQMEILSGTNVIETTTVSLDE